MALNVTYASSCSARYPAVYLISKVLLFLRFLYCLALLGSALILIHDETVLALAFTARLVCYSHYCNIIYASVITCDYVIIF